MLGLFDLQCELALFSNLLVARDVGLVECTLRMNTVTRVRSFPAIRAEILDGLWDDRYRLENAHIGPNCKAPARVEAGSPLRHRQHSF